MSSGKTLSQLFDHVYDNFKALVDSEEVASSESQELLAKTVKGLENLTNFVSSVDMFSKNETLGEMETKHLKFLLLPYMLGTLWQLSTKEKRKEICEISQVYFSDFLKRCEDYDLKGRGQGEKEDDDKPATILTPEQKRKRKVEKFKENQELDSRIAAFRNYSKKFTEEEQEDLAPLRGIYEAMLKRAFNDAEQQMDSIKVEMQLIKHQEEMGEDKLKGEASQPRVTLKPFIITKDAAQKAVYGMGYPSLPIMTVEELYQHRRETGEWGPPPTSGQHGQQQHAPEEEELQKELLEECDDEEEIRRRRDFDEYKDDHRRGWGNRFNRS